MDEHEAAGGRLFTSFTASIFNWKLLMGQLTAGKKKENFNWHSSGRY